MFKKFMTFVTVAVAALSLASCEKEGGKETPVLEFEKILYTVYDKGTVDVVIKSNVAVAEDVTIPVTFSGEAEKGVDYKIVARDDEGNEIAAEDVVTIEAGKTAGALTVKNISLSEKKQISVSFAVPEGYAAGTKKTAVVAPDSQEALVYSFQMARGYALESFVTTIKVTGTVSGTDFKAAEDITIPLSLTGEGASVLQFVEEGADTRSIAAPAKGPYAVLKAGQTSATVKFTVPEGYSGNKEACSRLTRMQTHVLLRAARPRLSQSQCAVSRLRINSWEHGSSARYSRRKNWSATGSNCLKLTKVRSLARMTDSHSLSQKRTTVQ